MKGFPFEIRFPMHWGEMDALGHANNVQYFRWFETARVEYLSRTGYHARPGADVGPILKHTECEYLKPVVYPAELVVSLRTARVGTTSFTVEQAIATADDPETPVALGRAVIVMVHYESGKPVPLPDEVRRAVEALQGGVEG